jgi:hypothetical protein
MLYAQPLCQNLSDCRKIWIDALFWTLAHGILWHLLFSADDSMVKNPALLRHWPLLCCVSCSATALCYGEDEGSVMDFNSTVMCSCAHHIPFLFLGDFAFGFDDGFWICCSYKHSTWLCMINSAFDIRQLIKTCKRKHVGGEKKFRIVWYSYYIVNS